MNGPTSPQNQLTLGGDPVLNIDSVSLFHFHQDWRIELLFISISHTVTGRFSQNLLNWLMPTRERYGIVGFNVPLDTL